MRRKANVGWIVALLTILAVATGETAEQAPKAKGQIGRPPVPKGVKAIRNIDYVGNGLVRQELDLYLPEDSEGPRPAVVWVHGGGWQNGSKEACRALFLATRGFAVASINYRLTDAGPFPAQIEDCRAAVRWLRANAAKYRIDPDHIGAWGGSAGGHLVALLGTAGDEKRWDDVGGNSDTSARVQAICDFFGHSDFLSMLDGDRPFPPNGPIAKLMGGPPREKRKLVKQASPITFVSKEDPPFLIVHGDHDQTVPLQQSQLLAQLLKDAGVDVTLLVVKNGQHGNWGPDADPDSGTINEKVATFFEKHLKAPKPKVPDARDGR
jgi:acetyl esterase/lipase